MRVDKFLWAVRVFKTRTLATEYCKKNRVFGINEQPFKPSKEIMPGETVIVKKNQISYCYKIINIPPNRVGAKLVSLYVQDLTDPLDLESMKLKNDAQKYYRQKGLGRPTKKDRRDLDDFFDDDENDLKWED